MTPPLDGMILPGVTRDSTLELAKSKLPSDWTVNERKLTIHEVKERAAKGELVEAFGTGTAAIVSPIDNIEFQGEQIKVPVSAGSSGEIALKINDWIKAIQYGDESFKTGLE